MADVKMKGMITGLTLDSGVNDLAVKFHVTLEVSHVVKVGVLKATLMTPYRRPSLCKLDISWTR